MRLLFTAISHINLNPSILCWCWCSPTNEAKKNIGRKARVAIGLIALWREEPVTFTCIYNLKDVLRAGVMLCGHAFCLMGSEVYAAKP